MNVNNFLKKAREEMKVGTIMISSADRFQIIRLSENLEDHVQNEDRILEIRVFNEQEERKLFRTNISSAFMERTIRDQNITDPDFDAANFEHMHFDETQYLDIDLTKGQDPKSMEVISTGGGKYALPCNPKNAKVTIRYYLDQYSDSGQVKIRDWRIVEFVEERK